MLYSDGLVENRKRGLDAGLDELVAVAGQAPADVVEDPERLLGYLVDRMLTGYEQDDDVTVLVLHIPHRGDEPSAGPPAPQRAAGGARDEKSGVRGTPGGACRVGFRAVTGPCGTTYLQTPPKVEGGKSAESGRCGERRWCGDRPRPSSQTRAVGSISRHTYAGEGVRVACQSGQP